MRKQIKKISNPSLKRRQRRKLAIRKKVIGTTERPRLSVSKSNENLYVQLIDDSCGKTLLGFGTFGKKAVVKGGNKENAKKLGLHFGTAMKQKKIETAVFDRGGFTYHGVIAALAEGFREAGIKI